MNDNPALRQSWGTYSVASKLLHRITIEHICPPRMRITACLSTTRAVSAVLRDVSVSSSISIPEGYHLCICQRCTPAGIVSPLQYHCVGTRLLPEALRDASLLALEFIAEVLALALDFRFSLVTQDSGVHARLLRSLQACHDFLSDSLFISRVDCQLSIRRLFFYSLLAMGRITAIDSSHYRRFLLCFSSLLFELVSVQRRIVTQNAC